MLTHIHIRNLAIVSALDLELRPGMTVVTGETGAGKSILVDALGLALGDRADGSAIRTGCDRAEISVAFDTTGLGEVNDWLREHSFDGGADCILRRVLVRDGRSRCFVNGSPVPLAQVQRLGEMLLDIHGQHAHQSLLRRSHQRRLLDAYGGNQDLATRVAALYRELNAAEGRLRALDEAARDQASRLDLLRFQEQELAGLNPGEGEPAELDEEHARLSNADRLRDTCRGLLLALYEEDDSIHARLAKAGGELESLLGADPSLAEPRQLLEGAAIQAQEAAAGLRDYLETLDSDPARLQQVEERLGEIHDLARKYRVRPEELPQRLVEVRAELDGLESADTRRADLAAAVETLRGQFLQEARRLSARRGQAARALERSVSETMHGLGMPKGRLAVRLDGRAESEAGGGGLETVEILVSANPGQPLLPLAKVASGGELSRISLAIQVVTAGCGTIPTLIFDEVDVGIGGGTAEIVGRMLRRLSAERQVLCVTHLPQVAAQGHEHLKVEKTSRREETWTEVASLASRPRVAEIARMLGGVEITDQTLAHAEEMLDKAQGA